MLRRPAMRFPPTIGANGANTPTMAVVPSSFRGMRYESTSWDTGVVSSRKPNLACRFAIVPTPFETSTSSAPSRSTFPPFSGEMVTITAQAPSALANLTPICPRPLSPITPTFWPSPTFRCRSGDQW